MIFRENQGPKQESKYYVACQGPLESTVADFWQMIWENQCRTIVQLTDLSENGVARCSEYLPPSEVLDCHRLYGDYQVTLKSRELKDHYVVSYIQLKCMDDNLIRELTHLWYTGWPSTGVPSDVKSVVALLLEARKGLSSSSSVKDHQPVVVHCSPGTGRTGAVLAIDTCLKQLDSSRGVDVPRCVHGLRQDRAGSVQTKEQYVFIYRVSQFCQFLSSFLAGLLNVFAKFWSVYQVCRFWWQVECFLSSVTGSGLVRYCFCFSVADCQICQVC